MGGVGYKFPAEIWNSEAYRSQIQSQKPQGRGSVEHACFVMLLSIINENSLLCMRFPFSSSNLL